MSRNTKGKLSPAQWAVIGGVATTLVTGIVAVIVAIIQNPPPPITPAPASVNCQVEASEMSSAKTVVKVGESVKVSVRASNPAGRAMLYNWQASYGSLNPDLRSATPESIYTAPSFATDDTISVDITMTGCKPVRRSIEISIIANNESPVPAPLDTLASIQTPALTPTPACPYQGRTDHDTIVNLIQAEADASNTKNIGIMQTIFAPDAKFYNDAPNPPELWIGPLDRYKDNLFKTTDFKDVEHVDILPGGQGIAENIAWYTSGSKGFYKINTGDWQAFSNGSRVSTTPPSTRYGSEHWLLEKNSVGCWVISQMEFNAGHIPFP